MPRRVHSRPRYRLHRASGQAIVEFGKRIHYLGRHGSHQEYERLIKQWEADLRASSDPLSSEQGMAWNPATQSPSNSGRFRLASLPIDLTPLLAPPTGEITVNELVARFSLFAVKWTPFFVPRNGLYP
jgi:hypothetical protein